MNSCLMIGRGVIIPARVVEVLNTATAEIDGAAAQIETIELSKVPQLTTNAISTVETMFTNSQIDDILSTMDDPPLILRELRGLNKTMQTIRVQTIRGVLTNTLTKLTELDEHIALEIRKPEETPEDTGRIIERLQNLRDEKAARSEAASASRKALIS